MTKCLQIFENSAHNKYFVFFHDEWGFVLILIYLSGVVSEWGFARWGLV